MRRKEIRKLREPRSKIPVASKGSPGDDFVKLKIELPGNNFVDLVLIAVSELKPHEETVPELLDSIKRDISRTGYQRDPILIDSETKIALDGMHRRAALLQEGAKYAMCAEYNYLSSGVVLERWLRYFIAPEKKMLKDLIYLFDLRRVSSVLDAIKKVDATNGKIGILSSAGSYVSEKKFDLFELYERVKEADKLARSKKLEIHVMAESEKLDVFSSKSVYCIYPPPLNKSDVLEIALSGELLPFKTTRHIVPVRPMGLYFPVEILKGKELEENNKKLKSIVRESRIGLLEKGTWYEGRRYNEPIAVFRRKDERIEPI